MPVTRKWKLQWWSGSKNSQHNFTRQECMLSFKGATLLLRETVTMLRSRNVIHKEPASFSCMIHVPVSIIIPVLKKNVYFLTPLVCLYIITIIWPKWHTILRFLLNNILKRKRSTEEEILVHSLSVFLFLVGLTTISG